MKTLAVLADIFWAIWNTGNRWARWAIVIIFACPLMLITAGIAGVPGWVIAILALVPFGAFVMLLLTRLDPAVVAVLALFEEGRTALQWIFNIVGAESALGIYFALVPVANDRKLASLLILAFVAFFFLSLGTKGKWAKRAMAVCLLIIVGVTTLFYYDWLSLTKKALTMNISDGATTEIPIQFRQGGYVKDGLWWPPQKTSVVPYAKVPNNVKCNDEETRCEVIFTCDTDLEFLYDVLPGETLEITHVMRKGDKNNGCSYSYTGDAYPFYGALGSIYDPKFVDDYPIPEAMGVPSQAIAFKLRGEGNSLVDAGSIKRPAGKMRLINATASCEKTTAVAEYNYPLQLQKKYREQFGWAGWSTQFIIERVPSTRSFNEEGCI